MYSFLRGSGTGLNTGEIMDLRMRGGLPRANAVKYVEEKHGVNMLSCICAIDRATLLALMEYWNPNVGVCGISELVGNALIMDGGKERDQDLGFEELPGVGEAAAAAAAAEAEAGESGNNEEGE